MAAATLAEKVREDFSKIRLNQAIVKVPKLKAGKQKPIKKSDKMPLSALISMIIKNTLDKAKKERKNAKITVGINYRTAPEEKDSPGGYGTASTFYGPKAKAAYVDYEKIFSYLGKFKARSVYDNAEHLAALNNSAEDKSFSLIGQEAMEKAGRFVKYLKPPAPNFDMHIMAMSLVPPHGMNSSDWEQFRLWIKLDPVMYALKSRIA